MTSGLPDGVLIRPATADDLDALFALRRERDSLNLGGFRALYERVIARPDREDLALVAERDVPTGEADRTSSQPEREVIAYARVGEFIPPAGLPENAAPRGHYLLGIHVRTDLRRRGIGRALTQARVDHTRDVAAASALYYFTNAQNAASRALHAALGFEDVTTDFTFPGVTFDGGVGVLCRLAFAISSGD